MCPRHVTRPGPWATRTRCAECKGLQGSLRPSHGSGRGTPAEDMEAVGRFPGSTKANLHWGCRRQWWRPRQDARAGALPLVGRWVLEAGWRPGRRDGGEGKLGESPARRGTGTQFSNVWYQSVWGRSVDLEMPFSGRGIGCYCVGRVRRPGIRGGVSLTVEIRKGP